MYNKVSGVSKPEGNIVGGELLLVPCATWLTKSGVEASFSLCLLPYSARPERSNLMFLGERAPNTAALPQAGVAFLLRHLSRRSVEKEFPEGLGRSRPSSS